jgi:hypothetical protein
LTLNFGHFIFSFATVSSFLLKRIRNDYDDAARDNVKSYFDKLDGGLKQEELQAWFSKKVNLVLNPLGATLSFPRDEIK